MLYAPLSQIKAKTTNKTIEALMHPRRDAFGFLIRGSDIIQ